MFSSVLFLVLLKVNGIGISLVMAFPEFSKSNVYLAFALDLIVHTPVIYISAGFHTKPKLPLNA